MPLIAAVAGALVVAVVLAVALTRTGDGDAGPGDTATGPSAPVSDVSLTPAGRGEMLAEPVSHPGPARFMPDTGDPEPMGTVERPRRTTYTGAARGLYGGTRNKAACDVPAQIDFLSSHEPQARAFAGALGIARQDIPRYLEGLTSVQLLQDTRVTNHGYAGGGRFTRYQAVLQAGTAVLIDDRGVPRVRCACGNPLREPEVDRTYKVAGKPWRGLQPSRAIVVRPAPEPVEVFVLHNVKGGDPISREAGDDKGRRDKETTGPADTASPAEDETATESPAEACTTIPPGEPTPAGATPCPPPSSPESGDSPPGEPRDADTGQSSPGGASPNGSPPVPPKDAPLTPAEP
ncbi:DUF6777 domain-containing protein [Streptomyces coeruleoprunus]|uniref:DUF6777 domain-containing protein n=1 Tax=Streptomyces coeruleoprunus TaxID=285563 RepID=A0ABV9XCE4_9ACTN